MTDDCTDVFSYSLSLSSSLSFSLSLLLSRCKCFGTHRINESQKIRIISQQNIEMKAVELLVVLHQNNSFVSHVRGFCVIVRYQAICENVLFVVTIQQVVSCCVSSVQVHWLKQNVSPFNLGDLIERTRFYERTANMSFVFGCSGSTSDMDMNNWYNISKPIFDRWTMIVADTC